MVDLPSMQKVEVYLVELYLCQHNDVDSHVVTQFSRMDTIGKVSGILNSAERGKMEGKTVGICPRKSFSLCPLLSCPLDIVLKEARNQFSVPAEDESRLWVKNADGSYERLRNLQMTVLDACLSSGQVTLLSPG